MNRTTIMMVALALGSSAWAMAMRPQSSAPQAFEDTGELLFKEFTDPTLASAMEVVMWDEDTATVERFSIEQKEGRWVIPSHNDYPADGTERMAKAAASFIDVKKEVSYGDKAEDHAAFGLLDPAGADGKADEKGKRITIKDGAGTVLVDIIVGKPIPQKQGMTYVRYPDNKRVYGAKLDLDISTRFSDWIEKDLLQVKREEIVSLTYDPYKVDEERGQVIDRRPMVFDLQEADGKSDWVAAAGVALPKGKELDTAKVRQIVSGVDNIQIVGVRPRPARLTTTELLTKGFFVTPDGRTLFGNEGEVAITTKDGVVYRLYFGEVTFETGRRLTAGAGGEPDKPDPQGSEGDKEEGEDAAADDEKTASRYMFVDIRYDPSKDQSADDSSASNEDAAAAPGEGDDVKGEARAMQLAQRFSQWFYVISDSSFQQIHKDRADLVKDAEDAAKGKDSK